MFTVAISHPSASPESVARLTARLGSVARTAALPQSAADPELVCGTTVADLVLLFDDPESVVAAVLIALRDDGDWGIGVGIGAIALPVGAPGSAALSAPGVRLALEAAADAVRKRPGRQVPVLIRGAVPSQYAEAAQAVLRLVGRLVLARSAAEWRVLDHLTPGQRGGQGSAAELLGISSQAVSKAVGRSAWVEEWDGRRAAALLLEAARQTVEEWS